MPQIYRVPIPLVKKLRRFLQDYKEANELLDKEESPDTFLAEMLVDTVFRYNMLEPASENLNIAIESLPDRLIPIIVDEAAARVLTSVSIRMQRNMIDYVDGNTRKQLNDKWQFYNTTIQRLRGGDAGSGFDKIVTQTKIHQNCDGAWGVVHSEMFDSYRTGGTDFISVII